MIALVMAYVAVVGGLCAAAAAWAERAALLARRPARLVWAVALVGASVLPVVAVCLPRQRAASGTSIAALLDLLAAAGAGNAGGAAAVVHAPGTGAALSLGVPDPLLAASWAALTAAALLRLARRTRNTRRALDTAARVPGARTLTVGRARVLVTSALGPAALGGRRSAVVLPRWAREDEDAERRRLVFAHEAEHLRAADPRLLGAAAVLVALAPWNPAGWWMLARLRAAVELDCDARVLARASRRGIPDTRVTARCGMLLLDVAARPAAAHPRTALTPALAGSFPRTLERRIRQMTAPRPARASVRVAAFALGTTLCAAAAFALPHPPAGAPGILGAPALHDTVPDLANITPGDILAVLDPQARAALQNEAHRTRSVYVIESGGRVLRAELSGEDLPGDVPATSIVPAGPGPHHTVIGGFGPGTLGPDSVRFVWIRTPDVRTVARSGHRTEYFAIARPRTGGGYETESATADSILLVIDGRVAGRGMTAAKAISPDSILSVDVLKGQLATTRYGAEGRNGVVVITTKRAGG